MEYRTFFSVVGLLAVLQVFPGSFVVQAGSNSKRTREDCDISCSSEEESEQSSFCSSENEEELVSREHCRRDIPSKRPWGGYWSPKKASRKRYTFKEISGFSCVPRGSSTRVEHVEKVFGGMRHLLGDIRCRSFENLWDGVGNFLKRLDTVLKEGNSDTTKGAVAVRIRRLGDKLLRDFVDFNADLQTKDQEIDQKYDRKIMEMTNRIIAEGIGSFERVIENLKDEQNHGLVKGDRGEEGVLLEEVKSLPRNIEERMNYSLGTLFREKENERQELVKSLRGKFVAEKLTPTFEKNIEEVLSDEMKKVVAKQRKEVRELVTARMGDISDKLVEMFVDAKGALPSVHYIESRRLYSAFPGPVSRRQSRVERGECDFGNFSSRDETCF